MRRKYRQQRRYNYITRSWDIVFVDLSTNQVVTEDQVSSSDYSDFTGGGGSFGGGGASSDYYDGGSSSGSSGGDW